MKKNQKPRKYIPPEATSSDTSHLIASSILSIIPGASELFHYIVTPPLEKRRQIWMQEISEAILDLESKRLLSIEELRTNDSFIDTLLHCSQIMARNSQREKHIALKNAVINSALPHTPEESLRQMYLEWIDIFTVWHLRILKFMDNPEQWIKKPGTLNIPGSVDIADVEKQWKEWKKERSPYDIDDLGVLIAFIETVFPELKEKKAFYKQIVRDLFARGLISIEDVLSVNWHGLLTKRTTELGEQFLEFINSSH